MKSIFTLFGIVSFLFAQTAPADDSHHPIGHIIRINKGYWALRLIGDETGSREAAQNGLIFEHDIVQTIAHQYLTVLMEDGSELVIGPSTRMIFKNWNGRNSDGRRIRTIRLVGGMIKAKVRKIYSQEEPFVIANPHGVVAVRGTEFVTEAGMSGRVGRELPTQEFAARASEVEVHTFEGEVHLARDMESLTDTSQRVSVSAGQTSLIRDNLVRPQPPHAFDVQKFSGYLAKSVPNVQVSIVKNSTNSRRAEIATNVGGKLETSSPARPSYAASTGRAFGRSIASVASDGVAGGAGALASTSAHRRGELRNDGMPVLSQPPPPSLYSSADAEKMRTTNGVHDALLGGDVQTASDQHTSIGLARQNPAAVQGTLDNPGFQRTPPVGVPPVPPGPVQPDGPGVKIPTTFPVKPGGH